MNFGVWGIALASFLFLAPGFIFVNVGFRCSKLFTAKEEILSKSYCMKVDEEFSYVLIGGGFIFLCFSLATMVFTVIVYLNSRHSKNTEKEIGSIAEIYIV